MKDYIREIKFRAWGIDGLIRTPQMWEWDKIKSVIDMWITDSGAVLMQFTGLHDKNGKEIYEGDVVKYNSEIWTDGQDYTGEVKYGNDRFGVDSEQDKKCCVNGFYNPEGANFQWEELEVIGNIYENPELLEGKS